MRARVRERSGVEAHLVRPSVDHRFGIRLVPDAATDSKRDEDLPGDRADGSRHRLPLLERGRDVEDHELVDPLHVVATREGGRIAGLAQLFELDALDDLSVPHVETRDDPFRQHELGPG